ncbi:MAG: hypothetical protein VXW65_12225 [Pseudomonadota bacterium]|nr:hypothetical protein [Pseudomonadota bacterium]
MKWSENLIAASLSTQFLNRQHLVVVPNCNWTGHECDLLCVTNDLRIIDFEIKISRSDFFADAKKSKWWHSRFLAIGHRRQAIREHVSSCEHPPKVWKHYYVMPAEIWTDDMLDRLPSQACGVLLLKMRDDQLRIVCVKKAKPARDCLKLSAEQAIAVARLAGLRMWSMIERGVAV